MKLLKGSQKKASGGSVGAPSELKVAQRPPK